MVKKVVASLALAGSMAVGSAGVAAAAPAPHCANAPARIARLQTEEAQVASAVTSLQALHPHGRRETARLDRQIAALTRMETSLSARLAALQAACPAGGPDTTVGSTSAV
ncbi:MAG: hypothetical protein ABSG81_07915 [Acidimicrobiales bacterium]